MAKILFIEGVSGVGKSTTTTKITKMLSQKGFSVKSYLEFDYHNPIDFYSSAYFKQEEYENLIKNYPRNIEDIKSNTTAVNSACIVRYYNQNNPLFPEPLLSELKEKEFCYKPKNLVSINEYSRVYRLVWDLFSKTYDSDIDFYIFDGSLLHHPVNDLIRNYDATNLQIITHINSLISAISSLNSFVCYIQTNDVCAQLHKARTNRNQTVASQKQLSFWEKRKEIDLAILREISLPYKIFDVSTGDWDYIVNSVVNCCSRGY